MLRNILAGTCLLILMTACGPAAPPPEAAAESQEPQPAEQARPAEISFIGDFATGNYPAPYYQKIMIGRIAGIGTKVSLTASPINEQPGCAFEADAREVDGHLEADLPYGGGKAVVIITPTETGISVTTKSEADQTAMLAVCRGSETMGGDYKRIQTTRMTGGFVYFADAALFTDCATGKKYPLLNTPTYLELERRYLYLDDRKIENGIPQPALTDLEGYFEEQKDPESGNVRTYLLVTRIYGMDGTRTCQ
ncbi:MAG: hypothetical protein H6562_14430 [Lewinellaceae bacterium]|nr:hypothetical protein [Lewinella sp.]MCB9280084.1 hypothetical protein [Lewinellaceae bacterium]